MQEISQQLQQVLCRIDQACQQAKRHPNNVRLLAVSKHQSAACIRVAYQAGQVDFGENYVQEAIDKMAQLADLPLVWHLIGALQSNKTAEVAAHFAWVHSVDRLKIAQRLSAQRPAHLPPLNVCVQVNIDHQATKSGCHPEQLSELVKAILLLPHVCLRGLMIIPQAGNEQAFTELAKIRQQLLATIPTLNPQLFDTLSMGMSQDIEPAISAGSTMVRVGTAIFGQRG